MLLLVGLGNPGSGYAHTRHNIGFMAADAIADAHGFDAPRGRFSAAVREGRLGARKALILKPQTYMNRSGASVGACVQFFKLEPAQVIVFHDDLDLVPGKVRTKIGGGHGGHNGLKSIDAAIGKEYRRVRLGIGHPGHRDAVTGYVLAPFPRAAREWLSPLLDAVARAAPALAEDDDGRFVSEVARLAPPPAPPEPPSKEE